MKKNHTRSKKQSLFEPDEIAILISQAVSRDLSSVKHVYDKTHPIGFLADVQSAQLLKKYKSSKSDQKSLEDLTFAKFREVNTHMANYATPEFLGNPQALRVLSSTPFLEAILVKARATVRQVLGYLSEDEFFDQCRNGPGTSIGTAYSDSSLEAKFTFPISMTARVAPLMKRYFAHNFQLRAAVEKFNDANPVSDWYTFVKGSRATTVDKSSTSRRMIAIEPTGNMYFQQGLMHCMYRRMERFGLDVTSLPETHQNRARISSITSKEATIDWSSASDCVSRELIRWLLPPTWFFYCDMVRSPIMLINNEEVELNMFSTMGNAVTFPLETLVFWAIGHACRTQMAGQRSLFVEHDEWNLVSAFGDDCIVPTDIAPVFIQTLERLGFIVNKEKSFYDTAGFRESCGGDYLHGYDVRPYSLRAPSSNKTSALEPWLYIIGNRLLQKYITCFGRLSYVYEKEFFKLLFGLFSKYGIHIKIVPYYYPDDSGLKIAFDLQRFALCYPAKFCKIAKSVHGTYDFSYCRFIYRQREKKFDDLHYILALQKPVLRETSPWRATKKKGGYIVAKGQTCHWHVPRLV